MNLRVDSTSHFGTEESSHLLVKSALTALAFEFAVLFVLSSSNTLLPTTPAAKEFSFVEAQVIQLPAEAHLTQSEKETVPSKKETTLSKSPSQGSKASNQSLSDEQNRTQAAPALAPSHGPIAVYAPHPVIPSYLQDREFKTSVIIDFFVESTGKATVRLAGSSGNEELDAIALETVKKWQFRPAEQDHRAIDSKVRLRIVFKVQ